MLVIELVFFGATCYFLLKFNINYIFRKCMRCVLPKYRIFIVIPIPNIYHNLDECYVLKRCQSSFPADRLGLYSFFTSRDVGVRHILT